VVGCCRAWLSVWGEVQICTWPSLIPLLLLQEIQIGFGFTLIVSAHPGRPGQNPESREMVVIVVVAVQYGMQYVFCTSSLLVAVMIGYLLVMSKQFVSRD